MVVGQKHILPSLRFSVGKKTRGQKNFYSNLHRPKPPRTHHHSPFLNRNFLDFSFQNNEAILFWTDCNWGSQCDWFNLILSQFSVVPVGVFARKNLPSKFLKNLKTVPENSKNISPTWCVLFRTRLIPHASYSARVLFRTAFPHAENIATTSYIWVIDQVIGRVLFLRVYGRPRRSLGP